MQFRKKPVVIEAVQFRAGEQDGELADDVIAGRVRYTEEGTMLIHTLEGTMEAQPGDWIIRGVKGELYPCKPDIFAATYEPASQKPAPGAAHAGHSTMQPHQQRVVDEKAELDAKIEKLTAFARTPIFAGLDSAERDRLSRQAAAMTSYSCILHDRIAAFAPAAA